MAVTASDSPKVSTSAWPQMRDAVDRAIADAVRTRQEARAVRARIATRPSAGQSRLSARERQVMALVSQGLTTKAIASRLRVTVNTVNYHLTNIYRKLGAHSRVEAVLLYQSEELAGALLPRPTQHPT